MQACIRCGLCLTSCPTYLLTMAEEESPRGRIALAKALTEGHLQFTADLLEHQNSCLVCEACTRICPAGFRMESLAVTLRRAFEQLQTRPWWQRILRYVVFRWLFGSPRYFRRLVALLRWYQRSGLRWLARKSGALRLLQLERLERYLPALDGDFLEPRGQRWGHAERTSEPVALFAGCVMSTVFAQTSHATARLLARAGYGVVAPTGQGCCGALNAHSGDRTGARLLARHNIAAFGGESPGWIAVNAAGCGAMLKEYGHLLADDPDYAERARGFAARVRDATELLAGRLPVISHASTPPMSEAERRPPEVVTYQEACHLAHAQGISRQPRELLGLATGVKLVEMPEASLCCGSAGLYNLTHPGQASKLVDRKLRHALSTGATTIVTTNPGCLLQLRAGLLERGSRVQVRHLLDLLDEAYAAAEGSREGQQLQPEPAP